MSYQKKIRIKFIFYEFLGLLIIGSILGVAYLHSKIIETALVMVLFFIYRRLFEKQYHASSLYLCGIISIIVFIVIIHLEVNLSISILYSALLTLIMTLISYYVKDYFDNKLLVKKYKAKLDSFSDKCLENLTEEEMIKLMPNIRYEVLHIVYGYLHRPKNLTASGYAYRNSVSEATLYRYLKQVKSKYESLGSIS